MTARKADPRIERWAQPETLYDAIDGTIYQAAIPPKQLAELLHISLGELYDLANPSRQRPLKAAQLVPLMRLTGDYRILQYLASACGFLLVRMPPVEATDRSCFTLARDVMRECAEAIDAFGLALEDGRVSAGEARRVAREVDEALAALSRIKATAERYAVAVPLAMAHRDGGQR